MEDFAEIVEPLGPESQPSAGASLLRTYAMAQGQSYREVAEAVGVDPAEIQRLFTERPTEEEMAAVVARSHDGWSEARIRRYYTRMARKHSEWTPEEQRAGVEVCVGDVLEARARLR